MKKKTDTFTTLKDFEDLTEALQTNKYSEIECNLLDTLYRLNLSRISGTLVVESLEDCMKHVTYDVLIYGKSTVKIK